MFEKLKSLFKPAPCTCPDLGDFTVDYVDDFAYKRLAVHIPLGGFISYFYNGVEVGRITDQGWQSAPF